MRDRYAQERALLGKCPINATAVKRREFLIETFGGGCQVCGYRRCRNGLVFHHVNPEEKRIGLSVLTCRLGLRTILAELQKCVLLCQNCHSEVHAGLPVDLEGAHDRSVAAARSIQAETWAQLGLSMLLSKVTSRNGPPSPRDAQL